MSVHYDSLCPGTFPQEFCRPHAIESNEGEDLLSKYLYHGRQGMKGGGILAQTKRYLINQKTITSNIARGCMLRLFQIGSACGNAKRLVKRTLECGLLQAHEKSDEISE